MPRSRVAIIVSAVLAAFTILFTGAGSGFAHSIASIRQGGGFTDNVAHAGSFSWVGGANSLGHGMDDYSPWQGSFTNVPVAEKPGRTWTLQEVVSNGMSFVNYHGEGEGDTLSVTTDSNRYRDVHYKGLDNEKLKKLRSTGTMLMGDLSASGTDILSGFSGIVYSVAHLMITTAFSPSFICDDPNNPNCVLNIVGLIGGKTDREGGLIGGLRDSLFLPLSGLMVLWALITIIAQWHKSPVRSITKVIVIIFALIMFAMVMTWPSRVARFPVSLAQTLGGCIMGVMGGGGCNGAQPDVKHVSGGSTSKANVICRSAVEGATADDKLALAVNGMMCSVWRNFQLDAYSRGSFGRSFAKMDVEDEKIKKAIEATGLSGDDFCVPLKSSGSAQDYFDKTLVLDGGTDHKACNIVAYQLFLRTDAESTTDKRDKNPVDQRWYKIILLTVNDDSLWNNWSFSVGSSMNRSFSVISSLMALLPAVALLAVVSLFAMIYEFISAILMVMLPVFALFALVPGRGWRLFKGWAGSLLSYVVKFAIAALMIVLATTLFSGVLDSVDNSALSSLIVILITFALFLYRAQMMDTLGPVDLGGEAMTNRLSQLGERFKERQGQRAAALGAGITAGAINSGVGDSIQKGDGFFKNVANAGSALTKGAIRGARHGLHDDAKRHGSDFTKKVIRTGDRLSTYARQDVESQIRSSAAAAESAGNDVASLERTQAAADATLSKHAGDYASNRAKADAMAPTVAAIREHEERVRLDLQVGYLSEYVAARNGLRDATYARGLAAYAGDVEAVAKYDAQRDEYSTQIKDLQEDYGADVLRMGEARYRSDVNKSLADGGIDLDKGSNLVVQEAYEADVMAESAAHSYREGVKQYNRNVDELNETKQYADAERARALSLTDARNGVRAGEKFSESKVRAAVDEADAAAEDSTLDYEAIPHKEDLRYSSSTLGEIVQDSMPDTSSEGDNDEGGSGEGSGGSPRGDGPKPSPNDGGGNSGGGGTGDSGDPAPQPVSDPVKPVKKITDQEQVKDQDPGPQGDNTGHEDNQDAPKQNIYDNVPQPGNQERPAPQHEDKVQPVPQQEDRVHEDKPQPVPQRENKAHQCGPAPVDPAPHQQGQPEPKPQYPDPKPQRPTQQEKPAPQQQPAPRVEQTPQPQPQGNQQPAPVKEEQRISFDLGRPAPQGVPPRNLAAAQTPQRKTDPDDAARSILSRMRNRNRRPQDTGPRDNYGPTEDNL